MRKAMVMLLAGVALTAAGAAAALTAAGPDLARAWLPSGGSCFGGIVGCELLGTRHTLADTVAVLRFEFWTGVTILCIGVVSLTLASFRLLKRAQ